MAKKPTKHQKLRAKLGRMTPTVLGMQLMMREAIYAEKEVEPWQGTGKKRKKVNT